MVVDLFVCYGVAMINVPPKPAGWVMAKPVTQHYALHVGLRADAPTLPKGLLQKTRPGRAAHPAREQFLQRYCSRDKTRHEDALQSIEAWAALHCGLGQRMGGLQAIGTLRRFHGRFCRRCADLQLSRSSSRFRRDRRARPTTSLSVAYDRPCRSFSCRRNSSISSGSPSPPSSERMPLSISPRNRRSFSTCDNSRWPICS